MLTDRDSDPNSTPRKLRPFLLIGIGLIIGGLMAGFFHAIPKLDAQSGSSPLTIQPQTGRVGIGTSSPAYTLDVAGTVNASAFRGDGSQLSNSIPSGAVMFFDLAVCPTGWSELTSAQGRVIVSRLSGGTLSGTVGSALGNLENRTHTHPYSDVIAHTHTIDPPSTTTDSQGAHTHALWQAYASEGSEETITVPSGIRYTSTNSALASAGSHTHSIDIAPFSSGSTGGTTGTTQTSSATMPYIQLTACKKS